MIDRVIADQLWHDAMVYCESEMIRVIEGERMSDNDWPNDDVLAMLRREAGEHKRAWALVAGLSKTILAERNARPARVSHKLVGDKPEGWSDRIRTLEAKIVNQKEKITDLEACRKFEQETECMLVEALAEIYRRPSDALRMSAIALDTFQKRMGPRPHA